jgi:S-ribosylhomocysteine lyase
VLGGDFRSEDIVELIQGMIESISSHEGEIPGATAAECGNFMEHDLFQAKAYAEKFKKEVLDVQNPEQFYYR